VIINIVVCIVCIIAYPFWNSPGKSVAEGGRGRKREGVKKIKNNNKEEERSNMKEEVRERKRESNVCEGKKIMSKEDD